MFPNASSTTLERARSRTKACAARAEGTTKSPARGSQTRTGLGFEEKSKFKSSALRERRDCIYQSQKRLLVIPRQAFAHIGQLVIATYLIDHDAR
jgi:hypothetical protein